MSARTVTTACLAIALATSTDARDQSGDNWHFGTNGGVTFVSGTPLPLAGGQINQFEGCATISDSSGNLLFYTDGVTIWNASHGIMPNGTGLKGDPSATQSAIIMPKPGDGDTFYVFTVPATGSADGLHYSIVDITLASGNGDVVGGQKNINLMATCSEQVTAVAHANGRDIWVIARPYGSNDFNVFLVSPAGVDTTPVISSTGISILANGDIGSLKAAPSGDKLAMAFLTQSGKVELYDFDNTTGQVSNALDLGNHNNAYGIEFSQDSTVLYVGRYTMALVQFDLTAGDIPGSAYIAANNGSIAALQLGPDGKIYVAMTGHNYLGVINSPAKTGAACDFQAIGPSISGTCGAGLPTFIQSLFAPSTDFSMEENDVLNFTQADFTTLYNDSTSKVLVQVKIITVPDEGTLAVSGTPVSVNDEFSVAELDNLTYTPDHYYHGDDSFKWQGNSGGAYNFTGTFLIEVTPVAQQPTVTTTAVSNITNNTADSGGNVTDDGGEAVTARGVCWSTSANPTIVDAKTEDSTGAGGFTSNITGLDANTAYHVRAYATNIIDTTYGADVTFTTLVEELEPERAPNLRITIETETGVTDVLVGDAVLVTVTVENVGTATATDVVVIVSLPDNTEFVSARLIAGAEAQTAPVIATVIDGDIVIEFGDIPADDSLQVEIVLRVMAAGELVLDASVTSEEITTPQAAESAAIINAEDEYLKIVKTITPLHLCGPLGFAPLFLLFGLIGTKLRRWQRGS